ncbi:hypothetical protein [Streptomyces lutosisoli]|uniref:Uncharacterized protein n=1 Tax=Streptomyces lutosisoli TaxID=2665721 RepID=A0ABW2VW73_9ACTN
MNTILAAQRPAEQRALSAGSRLLAAAFERHADALQAYIRGHNDLPTDDLYGVEDLASEVWASFAENLDRVDDRILDFSWLRMTANDVVRKAAAVEIVEVLAGFTGAELGLAVDVGEYGEDDEYAVAQLESAAKLIVGRTRTGKTSAAALYMIGEGVSAA